MLGIFDSGFGGLTVLKPIHELLPKLSTIYLGDNARAPYGVRSQEEIYRYTLEGVRFLFKQGCPLVLLACNTASSQALRRIQQEVLPIEFPDRKVLGVIRPAAEYLAKNGSTVGLFATPATVESETHIEEMKKLNSGIVVNQLACPGLTDLIESGRHEGGNCNQLVKHFSDELLARDGSIKHVLLACTHYPLVYNLFRKHIPDHIDIIPQGKLVAESLATYLERHPQMLERLDQEATRKYFTTGSDVSSLGSQFYGSEIEKWNKI